MATTRLCHANSHGPGKIVQVIGPVVDVEFAGGELPEINTALRDHEPVDRRHARTT